jgi:ribonuclease VapC
MVVDTSALFAILLREPDAGLFDQALADASVRLMSAVSRVALSLVIEGRKGEAGRADVEHLRRAVPIEVATVTTQQAEWAIGAFRRFGRQAPGGAEYRRLLLLRARPSNRPSAAVQGHRSAGRNSKPFVFFVFIAVPVCLSFNAARR